LELSRKLPAKGGKESLLKAGLVRRKSNEVNGPEIDEKRGI